MPIPNETVNMNFNFKYVSDDGNTSYFVRFHHLDEKPVVSLSEDDVDWYHLPASLFTDVTDFLRKQGVMGGSAKTIHIAAKTGSSLPGKPTQLPQATGTLPLPVSDSEPASPVDEGDGLESLGGLDGLASLVAPSTGQNIVEDSGIIDRPVTRGQRLPGNSEKSIKRV